MEFLSRDIPQAVAKLKIGHCPHGVKMVTGKQVFTELPSVNWSHTKGSSGSMSSSSQDLQVSAKVSLVWGLASGSVDYQKRSSSQNSKDSFVIHTTCTVQRGVTDITNATGVKGSKCTKDVCVYDPHYVSQVTSAGEASLFINMTVANNSAESSHTEKLQLNLLFASTSKCLESFVSSANINCSFHAVYKSPLEDQVREIRASSRAPAEVKHFLRELQMLEKEISSFPEAVYHLDKLDDRLLYKYSFARGEDVRGAGPTKKVTDSLSTVMFLDTVLQELRDARDQAKLILDRCRSLTDFVANVKRRIEQLKELDRDDLDLQDVKEIYGNHAGGFYLRELKRISTSANNH